MSIPRSGDNGLVLLADDGEPAADVAWLWVTSHRWAGWRLESVTIAHTLFPGSPEMGPSRHVERTLPTESGFTSWDHLDLKGDPRVVLLGRFDASLIVVGVHHRGHMAGLWAGSTTEWLLIHAPAPLLVARHGNLTRSVAICVDGSPHSQRALDVFLSLPWSVDVRVSLVSVADGTAEPEQSLARAAAAFTGRTSPECIRLVGSPKREIPAFVRSQRVDMVVLGTRGLTGLERLAVGSTVSALLKDETANLLITHVADDSI